MTGVGHEATLRRLRVLVAHVQPHKVAEASSSEPLVLSLVESISQPATVAASAPVPVAAPCGCACVTVCPWMPGCAP